MALTIAQFCRGNETLPLLAQGPRVYKGRRRHPDREGIENCLRHQHHTTPIYSHLRIFTSYFYTTSTPPQLPCSFSQAHPMPSACQKPRPVHPANPPRPSRTARPKGQGQGQPDIRQTREYKLAARRYVHIQHQHVLLFLFYLRMDSCLFFLVVVVTVEHAGSA